MADPERSKQPPTGGDEDQLARAVDLLNPSDDMCTYAEQWVREAAERFEADRARAERAPRLSELRKALTKIDKQSQALAELIEEWWPHIHRASAGYDSMEDWLDTETGGFTHHKVMTELPDRLRSDLATLAALTQSWRDRWPPDEGSQPRNMQTIFNGSPRLMMAVRSWELFQRFRPDEATARATGDFVEFVEIVYELATGNTADDAGENLDRHIRKAVDYCSNLFNRKPAVKRSFSAQSPIHSPVGIISEIMAPVGLSGAPTEFLDSFLRSELKSE